MSSSDSNCVTQLSATDGGGSMSDMFDDAGDWGGHACRGEGAELEAPKLPHAPVDWGTLPSRLVSDVVLHRGFNLYFEKRR